MVFHPPQKELSSQVFLPAPDYDGSRGLFSVPRASFAPLSAPLRGFPRDRDATDPKPRRPQPLRVTDADPGPEGGGHPVLASAI